MPSAIEVNLFQGVFNFIYKFNSLRQGPSGPSSLAPAPHEENAYLVQMELILCRFEQIYASLDRSV